MGFDYLRDNMCIYSNELVQRGHSFAIVDEVDSILIDEARTPLIISGQGEKSTQMYDMAEMFVSRLKKKVVVQVDDKEEEDADIDADYIVDEKAKTATLTASRHCQGGGILPCGEPVRSLQRHAEPPHQSGVEGPRHHEAGY